MLYFNSHARVGRDEGLQESLAGYRLISTCEIIVTARVGRDVSVPDVLSESVYFNSHARVGRDNSS